MQRTVHINTITYLDRMGPDGEEYTWAVWLTGEYFRGDPGRTSGPPEVCREPEDPEFRGTVSCACAREGRLPYLTPRGGRLSHLTPTYPQPWFSQKDWAKILDAAAYAARDALEQAGDVDALEQVGERDP